MDFGLLTNEQTTLVVAIAIAIATENKPTRFSLPYKRFGIIVFW